MRQILAIHREGSFGRAADALGVSQPTLSKSIARLEDELNLTLFDRSGSGAAVTAMGALIVERAERIIGEAERLSRDVELVGAGQLGEARIGVGSALRATFLPEFAEAVARKYPALGLELTVGSRDLLVGRLRTGRKDVIIAADAEDLDPREVIKVELFREPVVAVAAPSHPLAGRDWVSLEEFARHPAASASADSGFANDAMLGLAGEAGARAAFFRVNDFEPALRLARAGLATYIAPLHVVRSDIDAGRLVRLELDWSRELTFVAAMTPAASHSPVVRRLVDIAQERARELAGA